MGKTVQFQAERIVALEKEKAELEALQEEVVHNSDEQEASPVQTNEEQTSAKTAAVTEPRDVHTLGAVVEAEQLQLRRELAAASAECTRLTIALEAQKDLQLESEAARASSGWKRKPTT